MDAISSAFLSASVPDLQNHLLHEPMLRRRRLPTISCVMQEKGRTAESSPSPSPKPSFLVKTSSMLCDTIKNFFINRPAPPMNPWVDPKHVLSGNFASVDELPPTECEVEWGQLPPCLNGAYIRNGPNPQFQPDGPYHLFDGDGMLHAIRISNGRATLCSRCVKTNKYVTEHKTGSPVVPCFAAGFNGSATDPISAVAKMIAARFNPANGFGSVNTSLILFNNNMYALGEADLPYSVRVTPGDGDIETIGRHDFRGKLSRSMSPHPKMDPETRELFGFRYFPSPPFLTYFYFDSDGNKQRNVPIFSLTRPSLLHDFAITKKYAIFTDTQLEMKPMDMFFRGRAPFAVDMKRVSRVGIIPRYAKDGSEIKWFNVRGFNNLHFLNAWDDDDDVVEMIAPSVLSVEHTLENMDLAHRVVEKVRINLKTGIVSRVPLSMWNLEIGVVNPDYIGRRNQYVYATVGCPLPKLSGVVKLDVSTTSNGDSIAAANRMFGAGCYGGEPFFVAREPGNPNAEEDDGYVVSYIHDEGSGVSRFIVMDAKSSELEVVASVKLPQRVPYGFHGLFVTEADLNKIWDSSQPDDEKSL